MILYYTMYNEEAFSGLRDPNDDIINTYARIYVYT